MGAPAPPGRRKKFSGVIYRVSAPPGHEVHPPARARVIFRTVFAGRVRYRAIFRRSLRATTKKVVNFFGKKNCTPRQNPGYAYQLMLLTVVMLYTQNVGLLDLSEFVTLIVCICVRTASGSCNL